MLNFNMEYYRAFYYVAKLNSITKASESLFLTQPAVSRNIKELETHLNCTLFVRSSKGMFLTKEGALLFEYVEKGLDAFFLGEKRLIQLLNYEKGTLEIGTTETAIYEFLLPKIESFQKKHPKIFINLSGNSTPEVINMLMKNTIDFAVVVSPISDIPNLQVTEIQEFHDIIIAGTSFAAIKNKKLTTKELLNYPIVAVEKTTSSRENIDHWFQEQGLFFNPEYSVRTSTLILPFVKRNIAIGIIPSIFAREALLNEDIFEIKLSKPIYSRKIILASNRLNKPTDIAQLFLDHILNPNV